MSAARSLVLVANARMPSQRAQSLQVAQAAASFARAGVRATLLYAKRRDTPPPPSMAELWSYYAVPGGARPDAAAVRCIDWIDAFPRKLQYVPARLQELSFARNAARAVRERFGGALVVSREIETAYLLRGRPGVFLELHRVPGGDARRRWLVRAAEAASGVIAISGGVCEDLVELGVDPAKITVEHDAYEPGRFATSPSRAEARRVLGLDALRPLAVYTGGLLEWKGVDLIVEAAGALPHVTFLIAGGMDADVARLRERAHGLENVRLDGFQPPARVAVYLAAADIGLVPNRSRPAISARYTSPLKVFEAMAARLPLVVSDLKSMRDILTSEDAVFVAPDDASALAEGVGRVLGDDVLRERLSQRMAARSGEFTWDARAQRLLAWMRGRMSGDAEDRA